MLRPSGSAAAVKTTMTPQEYLAFERASEEKHEYFEGEIFAMAGCTRRHDRIAVNTLVALGNALGSGACEPFSSDMRVHVPATGLYTFPDVSVACGPKFEDATEDVLTNPCVIVEVLSDSTEAYDRGKKFENYRSLPSLKDYVLVAQDKMLIEHYARQPDGTWLLREVRAGQALHLTAVEVAIPIEALYVRAFPPPESAAPSS